VKFILDAHIPPSLCKIIDSFGHEAVHSSELPNANESTDSEIISYAVENEMIVVTKDSDFYYRFITNRMPPRLLLIKTGNIKTRELKSLFVQKFNKIILAFQDHSLVEIHKDYLVY
jgi:predicted nuclease of predicted toxin-antitoxin system